MQNITLNIDNNNNMRSVVDVFSNYNTATDTTLNIVYNYGRYLSNEVYLIICSFVNEIRTNNKVININFPITNQNKTLNYASRINFFKHIGIPYTENFNRHNQDGNFLEIENAPKGCFGIANKFRPVFENDFQMIETDIKDICLIINELVCNMAMHSKSSSGAYLYCQKFKTERKLEIIIVDSGIGIANSLSKAFPRLTNIEYLNKCIEFEVGCGEGRGHGLYFASEIMKRNNCNFELISGSNALKIANKTLTDNDYPNWNGVILKLIVNFDMKITWDDLMDEKTQQ
jgi:hypothetical protein